MSKLNTGLLLVPLLLHWGFMRNGTGASTESNSSEPHVPAAQSLNHVSPPTGEHVTLSLEWVRPLRDTRIAEWAQQLKDAGLKDFSILPRGAVHNGHYSGPKTIDTSWSSHVPANFRNRNEMVVEIDLLSEIPESLSPEDPNVLGPIESVIAPVGTLRWRATNEWGFPVESHYVYRFEELLPERGIGLEWEIGIYCRPLCLVDTYWDALFTPEEIEWQSDVRRCLVDAGLTYKEDILAVKDLQWRCAAARLTAACGLLRLASEFDQQGMNGQIFRSALPSVLIERLDKYPPNPSMVDPNIKDWLLNQYSGTPLQTVGDSWPAAALHELAHHNSGSLQTPPNPPNWVRIAVAIHTLGETANLEGFVTNFAAELAQDRDGSGANFG